jgi:tetratricopeptide (TPR) repeat protein
MRILAFVLSRAAIFYFMIFIFSMPLVDFPKIKLQSQLRDLNAILPASFKYLIQLSEGREVPNENRLKEYFFFYGRTAFYFPKEADALAMTGFCLYYLGDWKAAEENLKKSVLNQPNFFWSSYNLGLIYFKSSRFHEAAESFEKASLVAPEKTIEFINASPAIYRMIFQEDSDFAQKSPSRLKQATAQARQLTVLSYFYLKDYEKMLQAALNAIKQDPLNEDVFDFYCGIALFEMKQYKQAKDYFVKANQRNPQLKEASLYAQLCQKMEQAPNLFPQNTIESFLLAPPQFLQNTTRLQIF